MEGTIVYSTLPLPLAHEHSDIYLQLCMWGDSHVFLIATLVFTRLLLYEIYHLIELTFDWLIDDAMFVSLLDENIGFCYSDFDIDILTKYKQIMMWLVLCMSSISFCLLNIPEMPVYIVTLHDNSRFRQLTAESKAKCI